MEPLVKATPIQNDGDGYGSLPLQRQPWGSRVQLRRDDTALEVRIPARGCRCRTASRLLGCMYTGSVLCVFALLCWVGLSDPYHSGLAWSIGLGVVMTALIGFSAALLLQECYRLLFSACGSYKLTIDDSAITLERKLFFKTSISKLPRRAIVGVNVVSPGDNPKKESDGSKLVIWVGVHPMELGDNYTLEEVELLWLAYEITSFLNEPVHQHAQVC